MELSAKYNPAEVEGKWYSYWLEQKMFESKPDDRKPYTVVIPPPNVTGVLHMGHMLNNTIQDVLVRRARMRGYNACWVPGTDHASIATEAKVVKLLASQGIQKRDLSREEFLTHAWEWKEKYGGIILEQLKKLGSSCDWSRTRFTMEPSLYKAVVDVFVDLYKKGLIYRGTKMVNWDPQGLTTLSDEEVIFREIQDKLYYVKYTGVDFDGTLLVATARPETIAGDVAVCVNPADERYASLIGKHVRVPLINREVPIIADDYIDIEFGTGVLKVTPAHDIHDYEIGAKFNLKVIDTLTEDGRISEAGELFVGMDRFEARKEWVKQLNTSGLLEKVDDYTHNVGFSERTDAVVEPRISTQWFVDMKSFMAKNPEVLSSVMNDEVRFFPEKLKNTYRHWMENVRDWNISRQLWWGHRIPAWYTASGEFEVAASAEEACALFAAKGMTVNPSELEQDPDVLDTWFSSWLWPISVFDGIGEGADRSELDYYYPTQDLVTGPDILFFWVARMVMAGYEFEGKKPFENVYFTGLIRDKQRRKMSKSLGNSPDALELIERFGADAVRMGLLLCAPAGNDILFDESQIEQGRNFSNKIWNAYRLVGMWEPTEIDARPYESEASAWFQARLSSTLSENEHHFAQFRLSDALMNLYKLVWDDFCSVYLEAIKPAYGEQISKDAWNQARAFFSLIVRALHPFMPFITEELYHSLHDGQPDKACAIADYPEAGSTQSSMKIDPMTLVSELRNVRAQKGISPKERLMASAFGDSDLLAAYSRMIQKMANVDLVWNPEKRPASAVSFLAGTIEVLVELNFELDVEAEKAKIQQEMSRLQGFLKGVNAKLNNEKFVANAQGDVVERERQKQQDTLTKLHNLEGQLKALG
ncbi:MAG: valine--tRNA ligase [Bacteroidetes bacterium]|nr:valine--tRNA ligase [Bacteroidota bacterium]MDA0943993.1 valine--tRNA ligase [Bacteroidota bacterium]MDA1112214.1 valine--tRNA ligase [Bacteroidota bacterium]